MLFIIQIIALIKQITQESLMMTLIRYPMNNKHNESSQCKEYIDDNWWQRPKQEQKENYENKSQSDLSDQKFVKNEFLSPTLISIIFQKIFIYLIYSKFENHQIKILIKLQLYLPRYQRTAYKMKKKNNLELDYESYLEGLQNKQIGDYVVIKKIGQEDYATIYQAVKRSTQKFVAMKIIDLKVIDQDTNEKNKLIRRRLSETQPQLMALCNSQNVLKLEEVYENDMLKIMIIEYCNGKTLEDEIKDSERIEQAKAIQIIKQIINGLLELHRHNIVHRDLKVENILIHKGVYKIANFGFSKVIMPEVERRHTILGTINTMAPEVIARQPYGVKVDIWSVGIIFYQMLSGILPFTPMNLNRMHEQIINSKIIDDKNCLLLRGKIKCSPQVIDFLKRVLEINSKKRIGFSELLEHPMFNRKQQPQKDDQMYMQAKEIYLSCQKTQTILFEIIQPLENIKILTDNRFEVEFMYLLISRCLFNIRNINKKIEKKKEIEGSLKPKVNDLGDKVNKKFAIYSQKLTSAETKFMSIIADKWSGLLKRNESKEKSKFLEGIEEIIDVETSEIMTQELRDFTSQQQIDFTNNKYIPEIIKNLQQKSKNNQKIGDIEKIVRLLKCYKEINMITLHKLGEKTFQSYVKNLTK